VREREGLTERSLPHLFGCQSESEEHLDHYIHHYLCHGFCKGYLCIDIKAAEEDCEGLEQVAEPVETRTGSLTDFGCQ
jgi:hypothetical protein